MNVELAQDILKRRVETRRFLDGQEGVEIVEVEDVHVLLEERPWIVAIWTLSHCNQFKLHMT